jgi:hypothetical protein
MAKKAAPKHAEAEAIPDPAPAVSKADAVRQALAAGMESPGDGVGFIKSNYGIDMTSQMFSSYKAQEKARQAKKADGEPKGKPGRKPKAAPVEGIFTPPKAAKGSVIDDLSAIKTLVAKLGVAEVKKIAELFG